jgi:iron complex outermembrane receptor protein
LTFAVTTGSALPAVAQEVHHFDVGARSAAEAIKEFSDQSGVQIGVAGNQLGSKQLHPVSGDLSVKEGFSMLLAGTGLTPRYVGPRAVALVPDSSGGAIRLAEADRAQAVPAAAPSMSTEPDILEEIVVLAEKRPEKAEDIPKTVNVIKPDALDRSGVSQLSELGSLSPSLQAGVTGNMPGQRSLSMRGISTLPISQNLQAQVGIVLDDVPQPTWASLANELSDVQQIEILPGPQSTLSGRNAAAGLVNIVTRSPSFDWNATVGLDQTNDRQTRANAYVSGPLTKTVAFSLSGFWNRWDGNVRNVTLDNRLNGFNTRGGRGKVQWNVTDDLKLGASFFDQESSAGTVGGQSTTGAASSGALVYSDPNSKVLPRFDTTPAAKQLTIGALEPGITIGPDNNKYASPRHTNITAHDVGGSVRADYDFKFATLSNITSYAKSNQDVLGDFVAVNVPLPATDPYLHQTGISKNKVEEVRFRSDDGIGPLSYIVGYIYSDLQVDYNYRRALAPVDWFRVAETKSSAVYARATYEFPTGTSITAGGRYQNDKLSYNWLFRPTFTATSLTNAGNTTYDFGSGEASLQQKIGSNGMVYATFSHGESGKAYDTEDNATAQTGMPLTALASERVNDIEGGLKTHWLDRRVLADFDVFYAKYSNFPVQTTFLDPINPTAAPVFKTLAAGGARTEGVEFSVTALPVSTLKLGLNAAYVEAVFTDFANASCYKLQTAATGCVPGPNGSMVQTNLKGANLPYSPHWRVNLSADQTFRTGSLPFDLAVGAFWKYQSAVQFDPLGNPFTIQKGFGVLNLSSGVRGHQGTWSAELFVDNVLNKHHYSSLIDSQFWTGHTVIANLPRDWERFGGIRIRAQF